MCLKIMLAKTYNKFLKAKDNSIYRAYQLGYLNGKIERSNRAYMKVDDQVREILDKKQKEELK